MTKDELAEDVAEFGRMLKVHDKHTPRFTLPLSSWIPWFAWWPVRTDDRGWQWLKILYRRKLHAFDYGESVHYYYWQYRYDPR